MPRQRSRAAPASPRWRTCATHGKRPDEFQLRRAPGAAAWRSCRWRSRCARHRSSSLSTPESAAALAVCCRACGRIRSLSLDQWLRRERFQRARSSHDPGRQVYYRSSPVASTPSPALVEHWRQLQYKLLGRTVPGVERLPRSRFCLLKALEQPGQGGAGDRSTKSASTVGSCCRSDRALIDASPAKPLFECSGYLNHVECLRYVRAADLLFLPLRQDAGGHEGRHRAGQSLRIPGRGPADRPPCRRAMPATSSHQAPGFSPIRATWPGCWPRSRISMQNGNPGCRVPIGTGISSASLNGRVWRQNWPDSSDQVR